MKKYNTFTNGDVDPNNHVEIILGGTSNVHSKCLGCNTIVSSEHDFQEAVQTEATCKNKGVSKYTCDCGYSYTDNNIPINPNNHITEPVFVGTQDIHSQYMCCDVIVGDSSAHSYVESVLYAANCLFMGTTKYTCECGYYYTETNIPKDPNNHFSLTTNYEQFDNDYHNKTVRCYGCTYIETVQEEHVFENNTCTSCKYKKED